MSFRTHGRALPVVVDVRDEASVRAALDATVKRFGVVDICVNNLAVSRGAMSNPNAIDFCVDYAAGNAPSAAIGEDRSGVV
ncbi:MAG: SDR family oxidoreductase [Proteobacteria bacterium]|nr:SDR family oxidoreductase [Pseudomonadota bacterium]